MDCNIGVRDFESHSLYYNHIRTNTHVKGMDKIAPLRFFLKDEFGII